jgi:hypothetical protein
MGSNTKEYSKTYYEKNKEKIKENRKKYYSEHKDQCAEYYKKYYEKNKEKYTKNCKKSYYNMLSSSIYSINFSWKKYLDKNSRIVQEIDFQTFYLTKKIPDKHVRSSLLIKLGRGYISGQDVLNVLNEYQITFTEEDKEIFKKHNLM